MRIACYAVTINLNEAYDDVICMIHGGESGIMQLSGMPGFVGVHSDLRDGFFVFLFRTPSCRVHAYEMAQKLFRTAAIPFQTSYIDGDEF